MSPTLNVSLTPFILTTISSMSYVIVSALDDIKPANSAISSQLYDISFVVVLDFSAIPALEGGGVTFTMHVFCFPPHVIINSTSPYVSLEFINIFLLSISLVIIIPSLLIEIVGISSSSVSPI